MQTLLADSGLSSTFWGDAVLTVQYLRNRLPTSTLPADTTPFEVLYGKKPSASNLRVWGCQCFATIPPELRTKGGPRRVECIFVGYEKHHIGWCVRDMNGKYHFSRDVIFNESMAGRLGRKVSPPLTAARERICAITGMDFSESLDLAKGRRVIKQRSHGPSTPSGGGDGGAVRRVVMQGKGAEMQGEGDGLERTDLRRSSRLRAASTSSSLLIEDDLTDPVLADFISLLVSSAPLFCGGDLESLVSLEEAILAEHLLPAAFLSSASSPKTWNLKKEPKSYAKACARPDAAAWRAAMDREISGLKDMGAFEECDLPPGKKPLTLKWVFAVKTDTEGQVIEGKQKARVVAQGFRQRPEDFGETASPVVKLSSIRVVLAWAAFQDLEIYQFNCKTAFLHAKLRHDVYCHPIPGWPVSKPGRVLKIIAALYGLRQSAYEFYMLFFNLLVGLGLSCCPVDHGVFYGEWTSPPDSSIPMPLDNMPLLLFVPIHVDDGLAVTNSTPLYKWFLASLSKRLHIVDLGVCAKFLSMLIIRDRPSRKLWLSSHLYVADLLAEWNLSQCKTAQVPLPSISSKSNLLDPVPDDDLLPTYQCLVGCLMYLAVTTRPDIAFAAMWLGQYSSKPTRHHFLTAKHVLRYLAGTPTLCLSFGSPSLLPDVLQGFMKVLGCADADWASDSQDRQSISGYCFFFNGSLVSWSSVKQRVIALSSTEAEYYAMTHALKEGIWMRLFLSLLHLPVPSPFPLFCDNQATISLTPSESISSHSKHIEIKHHFIRSHIVDGSFSANWLPTSDMPADIFTKQLPLPAFIKHRNSLGLFPLPS